MKKVSSRPRVLLLWPGGLFTGGANFGVPQLVGMATFLERNSTAQVDVIDLDMEQGLGPVRLEALLASGYDLIGVSCYSSYDYLKVCAIAARLKQLAPRAWLCVGGYHPSARPEDFLRAGSPFDFVTIGDGEYSLLRLVEGLEDGRKPLVRVLGPDSLQNTGEVAPYDWSKLSRYLTIAKSRASQAEIYLSRGCPYDCSFCMERAKRDTSWRPLEAEAAAEEMHRFDAFVDLRGWTLFISDALFGMKRSWRREFLEALARRPVRATRTWLLIRLDLIEREDLELMARANISPGFGLESGDPQQLRRIRKSGKLEGYLDKMLQVADWARELQVPFGANIIVGHPGETESSLRTSAAYMKRLFLDDRGSFGFLSVDPFRLYPGSPIDQDLAQWQADTGLQVHRYPWWEDGDQSFLSEWVDPSAELDFRRGLRLQQELFLPILQALEKNFAFQGPAREYFMRSVTEQLKVHSAESQLYRLSRWHLWSGLISTPLEERLTGVVAGDVSTDPELSDLALNQRKRSLLTLGLDLETPLGCALLATPRERFVTDLCSIPEAQRDVAVMLSQNPDGSAAATLSALHSYARVYARLALSAGDHFTDLGGGTGYGAALAALLVGLSGSVHVIEIDTDLARRAELELSRLSRCYRVTNGDAHQTNLWRGSNKVACGFGISQATFDAWSGVLPLGGVLVAPVQIQGGQQLLVVRRLPQGLQTESLGGVRFVADRGVPSARPASAAKNDDAVYLAGGPA